MTRTAALAPLALAAASVVGCNAIVPTHAVYLADVKDDRTIVTDEAMAIRQYPVTSATYQSGAVVAGTTGFPYEPNFEVYDDYRYGFLATPLFIINLFALPVDLIQHPGPQVYEGQTIPPSYTAVPSTPVRPETFLGDPVEDAPAEAVPSAELGVPSGPAAPAPRTVERQTTAPGVTDPANPAPKVPTYDPKQDIHSEPDAPPQPDAAPRSTPTPPSGSPGIIFGEPTEPNQ